MKKHIISIFLLYSLLFNNYLSFAETKENNQYKLSIKDNVIINNMNQKIVKEIDKYWIEYRNNIISNFEKTLKKIKKNTKADIILNELIKKIQKTNLSNISKKHYKDSNIDIDTIKKEWLSRHNNARSLLWLKAYSYDSQLSSTAYEWSYEMAKKWLIEHKRNKEDSTYEYLVIEKWFQDRWVNCKIMNRTTTSESIWKYWYYCKDWDCTQEILPSLKEIFDIYMNEKWKSYDLHYRAIVHKNITKMWLWLYIKPTQEKDYYELYVTTHYCTEFNS